MAGKSSTAEPFDLKRDSSVAEQCLRREPVTIGTQARDDSSRDRRSVRVVTKAFAAMDVADMNFDDREA